MFGIEEQNISSKINRTWDRFTCIDMISFDINILKVQKIGKLPFKFFNCMRKYVSSIFMVNDLFFLKNYTSLIFFDKI